MKFIKDRCILCWVLVIAGWLFLALSLMGCGSSAPSRTKDDPVITDIAMELIALNGVPTLGTTSDFETRETVNASDYADLTAALGSGNRTVIITAGEYLTGKISIPSHTIIRMEPGVVLRDSGQLKDAESLITIKGENVRIIGHGAKVIAKRSDYTTGEHRHGVLIFGAHNVRIDGLESSGHGGDGFYIGGNDRYAQPVSDVALYGVAADNNRRQGLSITSGARIFVTDSEFSNTDGTAPQFGIDLEPNNPLDVLQDVVIVRPRTHGNTGGGILVFLAGLERKGSGRAVDIRIIDHHSEHESIRFLASDVREIDRVRRQRSH